MAAVRSFAARGGPPLLQVAEAARCTRDFSASPRSSRPPRPRAAHARSPPPPAPPGRRGCALRSRGLRLRRRLRRGQSRRRPRRGADIEPVFRAQYGCDVEAAGPSHGIPPSLPAPHPRPPHPKVPVDSSFDCLLQVQAYIRWEKVGKPNYPPEKQLVEFEEARKELQAELDKGTSIDQLRKKILKGNIESKVSKQLKNKKYFSVERIQRKSRDIMQLLNKHKPTVIEDQVETAPKQPTVLDLFTKSLQEQDGCKVLCRKLFKFADMEILALATNSLGQTKVYLATNHMEPLILLWALAKKAGEWKAPPSSILPSGSTLLDKACETLFSESELDGLHYQVVEIELDDGGYKGMPFVLRSGETWIKNNGSDFYLDFSTQLTKNIKGTGDAGKGTAKALLERIADLEEDAQRSLMHRFNIATDLVHQARRAGLLGIVGLFVWIIFMASRQLIWNKNYNVKPREISKAQDRFTDDLENMYRTHPQYREILRMIMSSVGRGGEGDVGQRIRDEILVIQRNNDCKGGMMEEWHQKLHNNTCPDDVVICQALIDYIRSDFDISVYWDTLNKNGITKERLLSYDRPIHSEPNFKSEQKEGLLCDLDNYMRSLKASTWKSSLECGLHTSTAAVGELGDIFYCCVFGFEAVQTVPAYPNICFSVDNFNDPFHAVVLSDPEHCYCVILNAHDGAAFPEETESDNNSSNIQSGVNSGSNEEKPQKIQSL